MEDRRRERIKAICQSIADECDFAGQHMQASAVRRAMYSDRPINKLPAWAYKKVIQSLRELQRDTEEWKRQS